MRVALWAVIYLYPLVHDAFLLSAKSSLAPATTHLTYFSYQDADDILELHYGPDCRLTPLVYVSILACSLPSDQNAAAIPMNS